MTCTSCAGTGHGAARGPDQNPLRAAGGASWLELLCRGDVVRATTRRGAADAPMRCRYE